MSETNIRKSVAGFEHRTAEVGDVTLHYVTGGTGEPLLLLHGFSQCWYEWRKIMPLLADKYTIVAPDLRGLGDSSKNVDDFDVGSVAGDIHKLVEQLGWERLKLVAHDWGGPVAYAFTAQQPEKVEKLVIIEAALPGAGWEQGWDFREGWSLQWFIPFLATPELPAKLVAGREREFLEYLYNSFYYNKAAMEPDAIDEYVRVYSEPNGMNTAFGYYRDVYKSAAQVKEFARQKLKMPVLGIGGEKSFGTLVENSLKNVAENVRGVVIENAGHFIPEEQPEVLVKEIEAFWSAS